MYTPNLIAGREAILDFIAVEYPITYVDTVGYSGNGLNLECKVTFRFINSEQL